MKLTKKLAAAGLAVLMAVNAVLIAGPSLASAADSGVDLEDGLIGYYSFDGTLGNAAGTGSAVLHGGAGDTWNTAASGTAAYAEGKNGQAYSFTGDVNGAKGEGLELDVDMPSEYTLSYWVNPDTVSSATSMVFSPIDLDNGLNIADNWFGATFPTVRIWGTQAAAADCYLDNWVDSASSLCGQWTYITLTCDDNGTTILYINGIQAASGTSIPGAFAGKDIFLGINFWDASFDGLMDDVAIYNRALTGTEVAVLYGNNGIPESVDYDGDEVVTTQHVSVHDPSIIKDESTGMYYIFGSHKAWAKSEDLIHWETFTNNISTDYDTIFATPASWAAKGGNQGDASGKYQVSGNLWAPDVIWNEAMQKWCMYMSVNGDNWYSSIVLLTADSLEGDWTYVGPIVYSGFMNESEAAETDYFDVVDAWDSRYTQNRNGNHTYGLNAIDPCVTYDEEGNLWMTYGSWFGGIYMLRLDEKTGLRDYNYTYETVDNVSDAYQGLKIAGGQHVSGEASYIEKMGDYYYLFMSYGALTAAGGYNMRVFRSEAITGPYVDYSGDDARYTTAKDNVNGTVGNRLMGGYQWSYMSSGQVAQGHNSAYYDEETGKAYVVYHTRFNNRGETHEVRVHQLFTNEDGWLVAAPFEYTGETLSDDVSTADVTGVYEVLFHKLALNYGNYEVVTGENLSFNEDGTISGDRTGTWTFSEAGAPYVTMTIGSVTYKGVFVRQQMENSIDTTWTFTVLGNDEISVWGYKYVGNGEELAQKAADNLVMPQGTFTDMTLPATGTNASTITWSSSNEALLTSDGKVTVPEEDTVVTLTGTFTVDGESVEKDYDIIVYSPQNSTENKVLATYFTGEKIDLTDAVEGTYQFANPFYDGTTNGVELYNGVSIKFDVEATAGADQWLTNIIGLNAGSTGGLYFVGNSYLGYNATGGYYDANVDNKNWVWGTDFLGSGASVEILLLPAGFEVYVNGELAYDQDDVGSEVPGGFSIDSFASVLDYLQNTASYLNFGWGSWWEGGYKGTISNVELSVLPLNEAADTTGYVYYEDFNTLVGKTGANTGWTTITEGQASKLSVTSGDEYYLNFAADATQSGNRGAYTLFGEDAQVSGSYTVELDTALTAGVLTQRSVSQLVIFGTDGSGYTTNDGVSAGYILKLENQPPEGTAANQSNYELQDQWYINGSDTAITIPVGAWVHIKAEVNTNDSTVAVTITDRETGEVIYEGTVDIDGTGELAGLYLLKGRGIGTASVDNITVKVNEPAVTVGSMDGDTPATLDWWDYSNFFRVDATEDFTINWKFTNYNPLGGNWQNYAVAVTTDLDSTSALEGLSDGSGAGLHWYLRADYWSNSTFADSTVNYVSDWDWDDFVSMLNGAEIDATLTRNGTTMTFTAVIEGSDGITYHYTATAENVPLDDVAVYLGGQDCCLEISEYSVSSEHHYEAVVTEPTCTEDGYTTYTCIYCGHSYVSDTVEALGHDWNEGEVTKEPTCEEEGEITYICDRCGETKTEEIPAVGHTPGTAVIENEVAATCEEAGSYESVVYCTVCGEEISRETVTVEALGHDWNEGEVTKEPTCEEEGEIIFICNRCGETKTEPIDALGHTWDEGEITKEPTCVEEGEKLLTCIVCGATSTEVIDALGHDWNEGEVTKEPTCEEEGEIIFTCNRCGESKTETIEALGHDWQITEEVPATPEADGMIVYTCSICGETKTEVIVYTDPSDDTETPDDTENSETPDNTEDSETPDDTQNSETPDDTENSETPDDTQNSETPDDTEKDTNSESLSPKTADSDLFVWMLVCAAIGCGLAGIAIAYRRKEDTMRK